MLLNIEQISQPYSGEYEEIIFDIESNWNSSDWSWIRFEEDTTIWCGEFRGKYIGATFECTDITCTPLGDVLLSSGYGLEILKERTISSCEAIVLPVNADSLRFVKYRGNILEMNCDEYCNWSNNITLFLNCETLCVMES